jgi:hypothetical protein
MDPNRPVQTLPDDQDIDPNDPTHWHADYGKAPDVDAPLVPRATEDLPDFPSCGRYNCGNHHHGPQSPPFGLAANLDLTKQVWRCSRCAQQGNIVTMHPLPCGHAICRACLNKAAAEIDRLMQTRRVEVDTLIANAEFLTEVSAQTAEGELTALVEDTAEGFYHRAQELVGLTCCNQIMHIERYLYCLDPEVAVSLFLNLEFLWTERKDRMFCVWPDCGAPISVHCYYVNRRDRIELERMHCLVCRGNGRGNSKHWSPAR